MVLGSSSLGDRGGLPQEPTSDGIVVGATWHNGRGCSAQEVADKKMSTSTLQCTSTEGLNMAFIAF